MPARKMIVLKPIVHHSVAIRMENQAHGLDASQLGPTPSTSLIARVTKPALLLNIHHHTSAMTETDRVHGTKYRPRKKFRPRIFVLRRAASSRPMPTRSGVLIRTNRTVFQTVFQNRP